MIKYYRVKKDTFLWKEGAIIKFNSSNGKNGGYSPIEYVWNVVEDQSDEYISRDIIESPNNAEYFERVYPDNLGGKFFKTKDQVVEMYKNSFK